MLGPVDTDRVRPMATVVLDAAIPGERHALPRLQASVAVAFDRREVDEQHVAIVGGDPPVTLLILVRGLRRRDWASRLASLAADQEPSSD